MAWVLLAAAACSAAAPTVRDTQPGQDIAPPPAAVASATPPAAAPRAADTGSHPSAPPASIEVIRQAYHDISGQLFREIAPRELLEPAWRAIGTEARRQGVADAEIGPFADRGADDIDAFVQELAAFISGPGRSLDTSRLGPAAVRAMAAAVGDSHTRFLTPEQADSQRRSAAGDTSYSGIGIRLNSEGGPFTIVEVFSNTPAERAGLRAGDRILRVNGRDAARIAPQELSGQVRGPEGTEVQLTIQRDGEGLREITLSRTRISLPIVVSRMLDAAVGYIRISSLPRRSAAVDAARDFDDQLRALVANGARGVMLDLRGNPGGDPFTSVAVASNFVPDGPIFVSIDRDGRRTTYPAASRTTLFQGPVAVLVDRGTASGAEVVASALQEYGVGYLIGARTCGCLSVGRPLPLGDSSGLVVTVERVLTGRRERSLEAAGLQPDLAVAAPPTPDPTDPQADRALAYLHSRLP